jgi:hypothetical protein
LVPWDSFSTASLVVGDASNALDSLAVAAVAGVIATGGKIASCPIVGGHVFGFDIT